MDLVTLSLLKDFLEDRPSWAFLALSLMCNVTLFTLYVRTSNARLADSKAAAAAMGAAYAAVSEAAHKSRKGARPAGRKE